MKVHGELSQSSQLTVAGGVALKLVLFYESGKLSRYPRKVKVSFVYCKMLFASYTAYNLQQTFNFRESLTVLVVRTNPPPPAARPVRAAPASRKGKQSQNRRSERIPVKTRFNMCTETLRRPLQILLPTASERWQWMFLNTWTTHTQRRR